jgi:hypothetical protein
MRPMRIDRDAFETVEQQADELGAGHEARHGGVILSQKFLT